MQLNTVSILIVAILVNGTGRLHATADDAVINTPVAIDSILGTWELDPRNEDDYKQRLHLGNSACGHWHQSQQTLPVSITFYVEGNELLIQHYFEPKEPFNYRLKQRRFRYKLNNDELTLSDQSETTTWKRIPIKEAKIENEDFTLRETIVSDNQSVFAIEARTGDGQLGIVVMVEIAKLAAKRGFRHFVPHEKGNSSVWVTFFRDDPRKQLKEYKADVVDVDMCLALDAM